MPVTPTPEQNTIVQSSATVIMVDAVAGAGKTTTLAILARESQAMDSRSGAVACLTLTPSAKERLRQKLLLEGAPKSCVPRTLLEFAQYATACLVRAHHIDSPLALRSQVDQRKRLVEAANSVWRKYENMEGNQFDLDLGGSTSRVDQVLAVLRRLKASLQAHALERSSGHRDVLHQIAESLDVPVEVIEICVTHERMRQRVPGEFSWQTDDDVVPDLVRLLKTIPDAVRDIPRFSLILIDEWHDVNAAEFELIRILRGDGRLVVVADRDQVVDDERGAELRFSTDTFFQAYPGAARLPLTRSHRFGASLARKAHAVGSRPVHAMDGLHTVQHELKYDPTDPKSCPLVVVAHIKKVNEQTLKTKYSDFVVIVREEDQSIDIENALFEEKIPYACSGMNSYLIRPEILFLRALLHVGAKHYETLRHDDSTIDLMAEALGTFVGMPSDYAAGYGKNDFDTKLTGKVPVIEYAKEAIRGNPEILHTFITGMLCKPQPWDEGPIARWKIRFGEIVDALPAKTGTSTAVDVLKGLRESLDIPAMVSRVVLRRSEARAAVNSIDAFIGFAERSGGAAREFLDELAGRQAVLAAKTTKQASRAQVTIASVRSAKGHEWPHVIIPYVQKGMFPRTGRTDEERRFMYVAMTRARDSLAVAEPSEAFRDQWSSLLHPGH